MTLFISDITNDITAVCKKIAELPLHERVEAINEARRLIHSVSPFSHEPVDCVMWVNAATVFANDYNPNTVAPPEMRLLEHSITQDGYTQPIVTWHQEGGHEVVDGFHRHRVGKESKAVSARIHGYLPVVAINSDRTDLTDRMAATVRHNRARGKHRVEAMSDMVVELKRRNWSDEKIARELGMDPDEVLRLCQLTGLAEMFSDQEFSLSWDIDDMEDAPEELLLEEAVA
jgi:ParB-like chromosome segregation protein Spo0J